MKNRRSIFVRSALCASLIFAVGQFRSPAPAQAQTRAQASRCAASLTSSAAFQGFLVANPALRAQTAGRQLDMYRLRGQLEWARIGRTLLARASFAQMFAGSDSDVDFSELASIDGDELLEAITDRETPGVQDLRLASDNPLPLMRLFVQAYVTQLDGDDRLAFSMASEAIERATPLLGRGNAGLILGYMILAQAHRGNGEWRRALEEADRGLAAIAAHPERADVLAAIRINLLLLKAEIVEAAQAEGDIPDPGIPGVERARDFRAEALSEQRRRTLALVSPQFSLAALVPGLQPLADWAQQYGQAGISFQLLDQFRAVTSGASIMAAVLPSVPTRPRRPSTPATSPRILEEAGACMEAGRTAASAGDFLTMSGSIESLLDLVNERNATTLVRDAFATYDSPAERALADGFEDFMDGLGYDGVGTTIWGLSFVGQGRIAPTVRLLEGSLTPEVARTGIEVMGRDPDRDLPMSAIRSHSDDLGRAFIFVRTAVAMLLRPVESRDIATMEAARRWAEGGGMTRLGRFLDQIRGEDDGDARASVGASQGFRAAERLTPAIFSSFGWGAAQTTGDISAKRRFESAIFGALEAQLRAEAPQDAARLARELNMLKSGSASAADRSLGPLEPVLTASVKAFHVTDTLASWGTFIDNVDSDDEIQLFISRVMANTAVPLAWREERWADVARLAARPSNLERVAEALQEYETDADDLALLSLLSSYSSYQLGALARLGRGREAVGLLDRALPEIRRLASSRETNGQLAQILPDFLLGNAAYVYAGQRRLDDAFLFARLRVRRVELTSSLPFEMGGLGLRGVGLDGPRQVFRSPAEQMIEIGRQLPSSDEVWNQLLQAIDSSKQSEASDAILLRASASTNPQTARLYQSYADAAGQREACSSARGPDGRLRPSCDLSRLGTELLRARSALLAALPAGSAALINSGVDIARLRAVLRPGELVVSTMVVEGRIVIFTLSRETGPRLALSPLAYRDVREQIGRVVNEFSLTGGAAVRAPDPAKLNALYSALIGPVEDQVRNARSIIWSPDQALARIPVAALMASSPLPTGDGEPTSFLGLARGITFAPRLSALVLQRELPRTAPPARSLAVGAIPFTGTGTRSSLGSSGTGPSAGDLLAYPPTPGAPGVIGQFTRLTNGGVLVGRDATLPALRSLGAQPLNFLLFYTHGLDGSGGSEAGLILAPGPGGELPLLTPAQILRLRMQPRYVLLAACSTGASRTGGVAPYGGVVRSFLALGSSAVLTAQGRVDETATAQLTADILAGLAGGNLPPAEALRLAQRRLQAQDRFANPIYWAQFIWVGDGGSR